MPYNEAVTKKPPPHQNSCDSQKTFGLVTVITKTLLNQLPFKVHRKTLAWNLHLIKTPKIDDQKRQFFNLIGITIEELLWSNYYPDSNIKEELEMKSNKSLIYSSLEVARAWFDSSRWHLLRWRSLIISWPLLCFIHELCPVSSSTKWVHTGPFRFWKNSRIQSTVCIKNVTFFGRQ